MIKFLTERQIVEHVRRNIRAADRVDLAVAFWGSGAVQQLGLAPIGKPIRILCDARSGACNPDELWLLLQHTSVELKTLDRLHAKVYWVPHCVLVGSANASANGLGREAIETTGSTEAALITDDVDTVFKSQFVV